MKRANFRYEFEITSADTVVDVGCGEGEACVLAGKLGAQVIGVDIEASQIARASERMRELPACSFRGLVSDANPIPLPDGTASVVICAEMLEHVDDPARVLAELVRIGKPGAHYLISVPDPASEAVMRVIAPSWYFEKPIHQHVFEHHQLDALVKAAGLTIEYRAGDGFEESMKWFIHMAVGVEHKFAPPPPSPIYDDWERAMAGLKALPRGLTLLRELDRLIPKSQVVIARKPSLSVRLAPGLDPAAWHRSRVKRWFKDGLVRVGGLDVRWSVRRSHVRQPSEDRVA